MIIIGAGNHSLDIQTIAARCGISPVLIYDDIPKPGIPRPPVGFNGPAIIGVNDPRIREQIAERLVLAGDSPLVDPSAIVGTHVNLGAGVVVAPVACLLTQVYLGEHVHVNYGATMTRCKVADFCTISPGATICGNVDIGACTTIGAGAVVCERSTIGSNVIVGAGAVVPPHSVVPNGSVIKGVWKNV